MTPEQSSYSKFSKLKLRVDDTPEEFRIPLSLEQIYTTTLRAFTLEAGDYHREEMKHPVHLNYAWRFSTLQRHIEIEGICSERNELDRF